MQILSKYLLDPLPKHQNAANHMISYFYGSRYLCIEYSNNKTTQNMQTNPIFQMASDAAFADNANKTSSEIYISKLFNGPIDWISRK